MSDYHKSFIVKSSFILKKNLTNMYKYIRSHVKI